MKKFNSTQGNGVPNGNNMDLSAIMQMLGKMNGNAPSPMPSQISDVLKSLPIYGNNIVDNNAEQDGQREEDTERAVMPTETPLSKTAIKFARSMAEHDAIVRRINESHVDKT